MATATLQTTSEVLEKDRVKLRVEVPEARLDAALDAAYRRWANDIKMPGFRKGKVPRQLIDARVGKDVVREEALRDALPDLYIEALRAEDMEAIAPPDVEVVRFEEGESIIFEATVDIRPEIPLPDLASVSVESPPTDVTDDDIDEQLERLRDRFAELEPIGREARRGDFVLIDLNGYQHDQPVEGASAPDYLYEVGSQTGPPKLDSELEGSRPGAILKFTDNVHIHHGDEDPHDHDHSTTEEISFTVLVKEVKTKKLPELNDDFAKTVGEFETLDALKDDLRERLVEVKRNMAEQELRGRVLEAIVDDSTFDPPEKLVEGEFEHRLQHLEADLARAGMTMDSYAAQINSTELEIRRDMRIQAQRAVKAELLLEEIARDQDLKVSDEDIGREVALAAAQAGRDPGEVAQNLVESGRVSAVAADVLRRKALDYAVRSVNVTGRGTDG